jgi:type IV secretory pathway VirJ component
MFVACAIRSRRWSEPADAKAVTVIRKLVNVGIIVAASSLVLGCAIDGARESTTDAQAAPRDLPLVEQSAAEKPRALAIMLSGDGGWRAIEERIAEGLTQSQIGVVGIDSLDYFWDAKTPERLASDLERIIRLYTTAWNVDDVLLVGYSFGADVLPAAINRLQAVDRDHVVQISLLGLADEAVFEFHVTNWLGIHSSGAQPIEPEAERLDMTKVQCVYGERESDSLCRRPVFHDAELIETGGGHHFDRDYEALAQHIVTGYRTRIAS